MTMPDELTAVVFINEAPQVEVSTGEIETVVTVDSVSAEVT
jgi:hypothetical protein